MVTSKSLCEKLCEAKCREALEKTSACSLNLTFPNECFTTRNHISSGCHTREKFRKHLKALCCVLFSGSLQFTTQEAPQGDCNWEMKNGDTFLLQSAAACSVVATRGSDPPVRSSSPRTANDDHSRRIRIRERFRGSFSFKSLTNYTRCKAFTDRSRCRSYMLHPCRKMHLRDIIS
jgi:hypothetical protein